MLERLNRGVVFTTLSALIILTGTYIAIQYAKGAFRFTGDGFVPGTGLLAANSFPPGAEISINGKLVSATDDTLYLEPGQYDVEISREGFSPWRKTLQIEQEFVTQTNATLFPAAPSLTALTFSGAERVLPSPDGLKLLFYTSSASAQTKNGYYILELSDSFLSNNREARQIAFDSSQSFNFDETEIIWSPDSNELLLLSPNKEVLLDISKNVNLSTQQDVSFQRRRTLSLWEEEMYLRERQFLREFPDEVIQMATESASNVYISPDKKRLLYTATASLTLPDNLVPPVPATNTQPEERTLQPGNVYVYDREEDKNFLVGFDETFITEDGVFIPPFTKELLATDLASNTPMSFEASPSAFTVLQASQSAQTARTFQTYHSSLYNPVNIQWFSDSKHFLFTQGSQIRIKEYDNSNDTLLFSGGFEDNFIYPWPDGSRLIMLTRFSPEVPYNLYSIGLRN